MCMHTFIPTYLPTYLCKYIHTYIHIYSENCFIHNWIIQESWLTSKLTEAKLALYQAMEAQCGGRGIALLFLNLGSRWGRWSTPVSMNTSRCSAFTCRVHMAVKFWLMGRSLGVGFSVLSFLIERKFPQDWHAWRQQIHTVTW